MSTPPLYALGQWIMSGTNYFTNVINTIKIINTIKVLTYFVEYHNDYLITYFRNTIKIINSIKILTYFWKQQGHQEVRQVLLG